MLYATLRPLHEECGGRNFPFCWWAIVLSLTALCQTLRVYKERSKIKPSWQFYCGWSLCSGLICCSRSSVVKATDLHTANLCSNPAVFWFDLCHTLAQLAILSALGTCHAITAHSMSGLLETAAVITALWNQKVSRQWWATDTMQELTSICINFHTRVVQSGIGCTVQQHCKTPAITRTLIWKENKSCTVVQPLSATHHH